MGRTMWIAVRRVSWAVALAAAMAGGSAAAEPVQSPRPGCVEVRPIREFNPPYLDGARRWCGPATEPVGSRGLPGRSSLAPLDGHCVSQARVLELRHSPVRLGVELGGEGVDGLERPPYRGAVWGGLRGEQAVPR
jgi:hypothetical protein